MICVLGRTGQVARALRAESEASGLGQFSFFGREDADFLVPQSVVALLEKTRPSLVINAVAYTNVDQAEREPDAAFQINAKMIGDVAAYCKQQKIPLIHLSTDYVFNGTGATPFHEEDLVQPLNVYGKSKAAGEESIRASGAQSLIFRTSWVYYWEGKNFVRTMLQLARDKEELNIVSDQVGAPTSAIEIARKLLMVCERIESSDFNHWGTYHLAASGETSWYSFAEQIFATARELGFELKIKKVFPIRSEDYPTPAKRPLNSRLSMNRFEHVFRTRLPEWSESLRECLTKIKAREGKASN